MRKLRADELKEYAEELREMQQELLERGRRLREILTATNDQYHIAYLLSRLEILTSREDHMWVSNDANLDDVIEKLEREAEEAAENEADEEE